MQGIQSLANLLGEMKGHSRQGPESFLALDVYVRPQEQLKAPH